MVTSGVPGSRDLSVGWSLHFEGAPGGVIIYARAGDRNIGESPAVPLFYRVVRTDPPTREDMLSLAARGRTPKQLTERERWMAQGLSVFDSVAGAERVARRARGRIGTLVAELDVPYSGPVTYELTGDHGHYTAWGEPDDVLSLVVRVFALSTL